MEMLGAEEMRAQSEQRNGNAKNGVLDAYGSGFGLESGSMDEYKAKLHEVNPIGQGGGRNTLEMLLNRSATWMKGGAPNSLSSGPCIDYRSVVIDDCPSKSEAATTVTAMGGASSTLSVDNITQMHQYQREKALQLAAAFKQISHHQNNNDENKPNVSEFSGAHSNIAASYGGESAKDVSRNDLFVSTSSPNLSRGGAPSTFCPPPFLPHLPLPSTSPFDLNTSMMMGGMYSNNVMNYYMGGAGGVAQPASIGLNFNNNNNNNNFSYFPPPPFDATFWRATMPGGGSSGGAQSAMGEGGGNLCGGGWGGGAFVGGLGACAAKNDNNNNNNNAIPLVAFFPSMGMVSKEKNFGDVIAKNINDNINNNNNDFLMINMDKKKQKRREKVNNNNNNAASTSKRKDTFGGSSRSSEVIGGSLPQPWSDCSFGLPLSKPLLEEQQPFSLSMLLEAAEALDTRKKREMNSRGMQPPVVDKAAALISTDVLSKKKPRIIIDDNDSAVNNGEDSDCPTLRSAASTVHSSSLSEIFDKKGNDCWESAKVKIDEEKTTVESVKHSNNNNNNNNENEKKKSIVDEKVENGGGEPQKMTKKTKKIIKKAVDEPKQEDATPEQPIRMVVAAGKKRKQGEREDDGVEAAATAAAAPQPSLPRKRKKKTRPVSTISDVVNEKEKQQEDENNNNNNMDDESDGDKSIDGTDDAHLPSPLAKQRTKKTFSEDTTVDESSDKEESDIEKETKKKSKKRRMHPRGYWNDFANVEQEIRDFLHRMGDRMDPHKMPTQRELREGGACGSLKDSFHLHGGTAAVACRMGLKVTVHRRVPGRKTNTSKRKGLKAKKEEDGEEEDGEEEAFATPTFVPQQPSEKGHEEEGTDCAASTEKEEEQSTKKQSAKKVEMDSNPKTSSSTTFTTFSIETASDETNDNDKINTIDVQSAFSQPTSDSPSLASWLLSGRRSLRSKGSTSDHMYLTKFI